MTPPAVADENFPVEIGVRGAVGAAGIVVVGVWTGVRAAAGRGGECAVRRSGGGIVVV